MTQIFKVKVINKELQPSLKKLGCVEMYFETQEAAECTMNVLNEMCVKEKTIQWECSIISVLSKQDALEQFQALAETFPEN